MGLMLGIFDVGTRFAFFRTFTAGLPTTFASSNTDYWRKPLPLLFVSLMTAWIRAPFEIAGKAFHGD